MAACLQRTSFGCSAALFWFNSISLSYIMFCTCQHCIDIKRNVQRWIACHSAALSCVSWFCFCPERWLVWRFLLICCLATAVFRCISLHCLVRQVHKGLKDYTHPQRRCQKWASGTWRCGLIWLHNYCYVLLACRGINDIILRCFTTLKTLRSS